MADFYPSEKGVIRRDRTGEARDVMARELMMESLGMIPIGGMAAKMSSPAVDVLSRWIRRYRKDKAPTVPLKNIEKALKHEYERSTKKIPVKRSMDDPLYPEYIQGRSMQPGSYMGPENLPVPWGRRGEAFLRRPLGAQEKEPFEDLWDFLEGIRKGSPPNSWPFRRTPRELYKEELARNWRKK